MNIVKIADIDPITIVDESKRVLYTHFKNLYAYCINWQYIVTFDDMQAEAEKTEGRTSEQQFLIFSQMDNIASALTESGITYGEYTAFVSEGWVDPTLTEKVNKITKYIEYNDFNPDDKELTIEQVKKFRTWLATELYEFLKDDPDVPYKTLEMLNYYKNEMTDDTIKHLSNFQVSTAASILQNTTASGCSCQSNSVSASLGAVVTCDPIAQYKQALYQYMVELFSDIDFWTDRETEFVTEMKKYIDAIIKLNLPLTTSAYVSELYDCNCLTIADSAQDRLMGILKNLSTALGYITDDDVTGHKNFIGDTLYDWSAKLYEIMRW